MSVTDLQVRLDDEGYGFPSVVRHKRCSVRTCFLPAHTLRSIFKRAFKENHVNIFRRNYSLSLYYLIYQSPGLRRIIPTLCKGFGGVERACVIPGE